MTKSKGIGTIPIHLQPNHNTNGLRENPQNIRKAPKKLFTILKEKGYSKSEIKTAYLEMAFYTLKELKETHEDDSQPVITRIVSNQFYLALTEGDYDKIKEIIAQVLGSLKRTIEATIDMSPTEIIVEEGEKV